MPLDIMAPTARSPSGMPHAGRKRQQGQQGRSPTRTRGSLSASPGPAQQVTGDEYSISYHHRQQSVEHFNPPKKFKPDLGVRTRSPPEFGSPTVASSHIFGQNHPSAAVNDCPGSHSTFWHPATSDVNPVGSPKELSQTADYRTDFAHTYTSHPIPLSRSSIVLTHPNYLSTPHPTSPYDQYLPAIGRYHSHSPNSGLPNPPISESSAFQSPTTVLSGISAHPGHTSQQPEQLLEYSARQQYSPAGTHPHHPAGPDLHVHSPHPQSQFWSLEVHPYPPHHHQQAAEIFLRSPSSIPRHHWTGNRMDDERWHWEVNHGSEDQLKRQLELELAPRETLGHPSLQLPEPPVDQDSDIEDSSATEEGTEGDTPKRKDGHPNPKRRGIFEPDKREETSKTRKKGACVRCKIQKIRCDGDSVCAGCHKVGLNGNKKVIHHVPCRRWKMQEVVWTRNGGLDLTKRWQGVEAKNIPQMGDSGLKVAQTVGIKILFFNHGSGPENWQTVELCDIPLKVDVHLFDPQEGDVLHRYWTRRRNGVIVDQGVVEMLPYCVVDIEQTRKVLDGYFDRHAAEALKQTAENNADDMVREVFKLALQHWKSLPDGEEKVLMGSLFQLWFAMRFATGSACLDPSENDLGMESETNVNAPTFGKISVPRMITAQIDSINAKHFTRKLSKKILAQLEAFFRSNNPELWLTLFLSTFIFLHEVGHSTRDRFRHARQRDHNERYTQPDFVRELHHGANIVLIHWQYYKSNVCPASNGWRVHTREEREADHAEYAAAMLAANTTGNKKGEKEKKPKPKVLLTVTQRNVVEKWWGIMEDAANVKTSHLLGGGADYHQPGAWEEPMYYLSQIFQHNWHPIDGYAGQG